MPKRDRPQPTHDEVLENLETGLRKVFKATVKLETAGPVKAGIVTLQEVGEKMVAVATEVAAEIATE